MIERARDPFHHKVASSIALAGHPIHVMLVTFPIALTVGTLGADFYYWWSGDPFFARVALWTSGWGFGMGLLAALSGFAEMLLSKGIRRRVEPWSHAIAAMLLLAILGANWGLRLAQGVDAALPWGLFLSAIGLGSVGLAGWHGGKLVFEHQIGIDLERNG
jgi:uncharacterized membrane protein